MISESRGARGHSSGRSHNPRGNRAPGRFSAPRKFHSSEGASRTPAHSAHSASHGTHSASRGHVSASRSHASASHSHAPASRTQTVIRSSVLKQAEFGGGYRGGSSRFGGNSRGGSRGFSGGRSFGGSGSHSRGGSRGFSGGRSFGGSQGGRGRGGRSSKFFDVSKYINKNPAAPKIEVYMPKHTFSDFAVDPRIHALIARKGITTPTPIQDQVIPHILEGKDVVGLAETGTGKTAAFLVPLINKMIKDPKLTTLILTPTRELAIQIENELRTLSFGLGIFGTCCVGGVSIGGQLRSLKFHQHFIIGTPGRVKDLIERKAIFPSRISTVVLDEADRMLDMGFINDMKAILGAMPAHRHTLFFSATMSDEIKKLVHDFLKNPVTVALSTGQAAASIEQDVVFCKGADKVDVLADLLAKPEFTRVIIFGHTKHGVEKLMSKLATKNITTDSIHGNKNHNQRQRALNAFKSGEVRVLVATDVAARGIHVDNVSHVINFDLPVSYEDYIHRIGRTGRGAQRGKALTLIA